MAEPPERLELAKLEAEFNTLSASARRGVLMLLGLAIGDAVGLPFELGVHRFQRKEADEIAVTRGEQGLHHFVLQRIVERLGRRGPSNAFARAYSDDSVCTDLKMAAIAQCSELLQQPAYRDQPAQHLLWRCFLSQLLSWSGGRAAGQLFQGYGGFTRGLLRPEGVPRNMAPCLDIGESLPGCETWPEEWFVEHAERHCSGGDGGIASYGNGVVMSFAPQLLAGEILSEGADSGKRSDGSDAVSTKVPIMLDADTLQALQLTHRHPDAQRGAKLLAELLHQVMQGSIQTCDELRGIVRRCTCWQELLSSSLLDHPAYPLQAFSTFLAEGDCTEEEFQTFLLRFSRADSPQPAMELTGAYARQPGGARMGRLLRTAANWDDDHRPSAEEGGDEQMNRHLTLEDGEAVRFSQRGLNTVLIAVWCCSGATSCWDWLLRLLYIGGDSDTVGAVCGQIAGPLLPGRDVCQSFQHFVAVADCTDLEPCARIASAAAVRYHSRALLFATGRWSDLARRPRLVDPTYERLTDSVGGSASGARPVRVLWLDTAFSDHPGRTGASRRAAAEEADRRGVIKLSSAPSAEGAISLMHSARNGGPDGRADVIVSELHFGRASTYAGLELLQMVDSIWDGGADGRPLFLLLTPNQDREVTATVRRHRNTALARCDRPQAVLQTIMEARCCAAVLPAVGDRFQSL